MTGRPADTAEPAGAQQDTLDLRAELAARRMRTERSPEPGQHSPSRAVAGAAVSVAGVCLGIATLLWVTADPSPSQGREVTAPASSDRVPEGSAAVDGLEGAASDGREGSAGFEGTGDAASSTGAGEPGVPVGPPVPEEPVAPPAVVEAPAAIAPPPSVPAPPAAPAPAAPDQVAAEVVPVTVLNNSRITGLADRAAASFRADGWPVAATGNFRGRIPVTTVYYDDPALQASAQAFADAFGGVARVRPAFDGLPASGVVVVVTRDFPA